MDKKQKAAMTKKRKKERERIVDLLKENGTYNKSLEPLIELYLDAYMVYSHVYEQWRDEGFPATKEHTNKAGAKNQMKHPLAQQTADWNARMSKLLEQLGLTPKMQKQISGEVTNSTTDAFQAFANKWD
ncbi:phage terminase small subunit P27 family [Thermaerobacillus caldiproteolyticus]|uniref:phage terminase small subunit P27 family n=1 Tax=Thermaerobacillus caldiproteolyticus TaxID=247480 RepID=UPI001889FD9D|nr:phage terminase small subunit P27 family [Anoxybacillus caldiproteolyticus]QPA31619.1 phage terminase small subunit P27 family [Anoxybacillus caldiproteolyticus]